MKNKLIIYIQLNSIKKKSNDIRVKKKYIFEEEVNLFEIE